MSHPTPATAVTLRDYWDQLYRHDWRFEYSDDYGVWERGKEEQHRLHVIGLQSPKHSAMFNAMSAWGWGNGPLPPQPEAEAA